MKILDLNVYSVYLKHPSIWSGGRRLRIESNGVLIVIDSDEDIKGYGSTYHPISDEKENETLQFLKEVKTSLVGMDPSDIEGIHEFLDKRIPIDKTAARTAIDVACYDILGKAKEKTIYQLLGQEKPNVVPIAFNIYMKNHQEKPEEMANTAKDVMENHNSNGVKRLSLHLPEGDEKNDMKRIEAVTEIFPGELTLDLSYGFKDPKVAVNFLNQVHEKLGDRLILVEQPCPDISSLKYVSDNLEIPIFIHSRPKTISDVQKIIDARAVTGIGLHMYRMGGFYLCKKISELIKKNGLEIMAGCGGWDGLISTAAVHLATGIINVINTDVSNDLLSPSTWLVTEETMPIFKDGARIPLERPGLGIELKECVKKQFEKTRIVRLEN
jgi:L-alanine-DL-glutamate epimerase-like enolase superfamily enzyme